MKYDCQEKRKEMEKKKIKKRWRIPKWGVGEVVHVAVCFIKG